MVINDINYLESSNEEVFGGGSSRGRRSGFKKDIDINYEADYDVDVDLKLNFKGNGANADAYASGKDTYTETYAEVKENRYSLSESAAFAS